MNPPPANPPSDPLHNVPAELLARYETPPPGLVAQYSEPPRPRRRGPVRRPRLTVVLFLLTCLSAFVVGFKPGGGPTAVWELAMLAKPLADFYRRNGELPAGFVPLLVGYLWNGLIYASCVMGILLAHEMGHFLQAVRYGIPASFPFFIPFPISPFGTMGAVIVQEGGVADRKQMFDIAVSGPLAGLVVAIPVLLYGISTATIIPAVAGTGIRYGDPLLLQWLVAALHGEYGPNQDVLRNAPLFAGWVGLFITALNLIPVGQLDGGHILYTLVGRRAHYVAYAVLGIAIAWMIFGRRPDYLLIVVLLLFLGPRHPPTRDDSVALGWPRIVLGWLTLAFIVIGFTPTPIVAG